MFKPQDVKTKALKNTYGEAFTSLYVSVPAGYSVHELVYGGDKVKKGEIFLTTDLMVSFPLAQDEEVAEGHAVIVLRPVNPIKPAPIYHWDSAAQSAYTHGCLILPQDIYGKSLIEMQQILKDLKAQVLNFRIVRLGEKYLVHDCKRIATLTTANNNASQKFVRFIVK